MRQRVNEIHQVLAMASWAKQIRTVLIKRWWKTGVETNVNQVLYLVPSLLLFQMELLNAAIIVA
jgi:hypothetical protein